jgi:SAM-dependent methyltransferase
MKYNKDFYINRNQNTRASAEIIAGIINEIYDVKTVVDVGCGIGTWLSVFKDFGAKRIFGIDGPWVDKTMLKIPGDCFSSQDLTAPACLGNFDLAISLEVAEHLPEQYAEQFAENLTRLAPVVLFSAAIPFQGGINHVNEQWPCYWINIFNKKGYVPVDFIRKRIWDTPEVLPHYAQNILLFVREDHILKNAALKAEYERNSILPIDLVHPRLYMSVINDMSLQEKSFKAAVKESLAALAIIFERWIKKKLSASSRLRA